MVAKLHLQVSSCSPFIHQYQKSHLKTGYKSIRKKNKVAFLIYIKEAN
jgi:hypothetical protein